MRIGRRKVLAAASAVLLAAVAWLAWDWGGTDALLGVVLLAILLGTAVVGYWVIRAERRVVSTVGVRPGLNSLFDRLVRVEAELKVLREDVAQTQRHMSDRLEEFEISVLSQVESLVQHPGAQSEALLKAINAGYSRASAEQTRWMRRVDNGIRRSERATARLFNHAPAEIDALNQVHRRLGMEGSLPLLGGWALTPRGMLQTIDLTFDEDVSLIVECGSGTSTVFLARVLQMKGRGKIVALEHLEEFAELARKAIQEHGLGDFAEVRYAPLEEIEIGGDSFNWYSLDSVSDLEDIDMLIVDGPPGGTGPNARFPAFPLLRDRLSSSGIVILDDVQREDEKGIVETWLEDGRLSQVHSLGPDQVVLRPAPPASLSL